MAILYFSDVLQKVGIDPAKVKLIRHSLNHKGFKVCFDANKIFEYTCHQDKNFAKGFEYWIVFISAESTLAKLYSCYKVEGCIPDTPDNMFDNLPDIEKEKWNGEHARFTLEPIDLLKEYEDRLVIDWGRGRRWDQNGINNKPIIYIQSEKSADFPGYEKLLLSYDQLKKHIEKENILKRPIDYEVWYTALSSINAIYLIIDKKSGKQYIGSTYGEEGLFGRWYNYVLTKDGGNIKIKKLLKEDSERYNYFQFSILQVLPKSISKDEAIAIENLYKDKLLSREFGLNDN